MYPHHHGFAFLRSGRGPDVEIEAVLAHGIGARAVEGFRGTPVLHARGRERRRVPDTLPRRDRRQGTPATHPKRRGSVWDPAVHPDICPLAPRDAADAATIDTHDTAIDRCLRVLTRRAAEQREQGGTNKRDPSNSHVAPSRPDGDRHGDRRRTQSIILLIRAPPASGRPPDARGDGAAKLLADR